MNEPRLTTEEFGLLRRMVYAQTGIALGESKRALLESRLRKRVRELGLGSYLAYYRRLKDAAEPAELQALVDAITTNTTAFFREPAHFERLAREVVPAWARRPAGAGRRRLRLWSAACSTGQEPYSMAAVLRAGLGEAGDFDARILATDVSERALRAAEGGEYPADALATIPPAWKGGFAARGVGPERRMAVSEALRQLVTFRPLNLLAESYPFHGRFDAVFCRNVLIYFDAPTKEEVVRRMAGVLHEGGYLFLGLSEALVKVPRGLEALGQSVYRRTGEVG